MEELISYLLAATGFTVLVVWPSAGPSAWVRERLIRPLLPPRARGVLDCYVCCGPWCGLLLSPVWWTVSNTAWVWFGPLMIPAIFWFILRPDRADIREEG